MASFWKLRIWDSPSRTTVIADIVDIITYDWDDETNQPIQCTATVNLTDPNTAGINRAMWAEMYAGNPSFQDMRHAGEIIQITKQEDAVSSLAITFQSAAHALTHFRVPPMHFKYGKKSGGGIIYRDYVDVINGRADVAGRRGILTGSGITYRYRDPGGTIGSGSTTTPPGAGDSSEIEYDSAANALSAIHSNYNLFWRDDPTNYPHNGTIDGGPLGDDSGYTIWGGEDLAARQSRDTTAYGHQFNAQTAQQAGDAIIMAASYQEDVQHKLNLFWLLGHDGGHGSTTIYKKVGGHPVNKGGDPDVPINGWTLYRPFTGERRYYVKNCPKATYLTPANTYKYVATQDNQGGWSYGVLNKDAADADQPREDTIEEQSIKDPNWLVSAGLGALDYHKFTLAQWQFAVLHPLTSSSGWPQMPRPGQVMTIHYSGQVHDAITKDPTTGQPTSAGAFTYMSYPGTTDPNAINKLKFVMGVSGHWDDAGGLQVTYTLGHGRWKDNEWVKYHNRKIAHNKRKHRRKHKAHRRPHHDVAFTADDESTAYEDPTNDSFVLEPTGIWVSDIDPINSTPYPDHTEWAFDIDALATDQELRFWFDKPTSPDLTSSNPGVLYAGMRFAGTATGTICKFFTTTDGTTLTNRGSAYRDGLLDSNHRLPSAAYRISVRRSGRIHECHVTPLSGSGVYAPHHIAGWDDGGGVTTIGGAIGWQLLGGTASVNLQNIDAKEWHRKQKTRRDLDPHHPSRYYFENLQFSFAAAGDPAIMNWDQEDATKHSYLKTDDGTIIRDWLAGASSSIASVPAGAVIVYNSAPSGSIDVYDADGVSNHRSVTAQGFDWVYASNDLTTSDARPLYKAAVVSASVDSDSGRLTTKGWQSNTHKVQHDNIQDDAVARRKIKGGSATAPVSSAGAVLSARATADAGAGATGDVQWTGSGGVTVTRSGAIITIDGSGAGSGMTNPMTTIDDIIVGGTAGAPGRLAKGSDGDVLTVDPTTHHVAWDAPAAAPAFRYGTATITGNSSSTDFFISFSSTMPNTPHVTITQLMSGSITGGGVWNVGARSTGGFHIANPGGYVLATGATIDFDYIAVSDP